MDEIAFSCIFLARIILKSKFPSGELDFQYQWWANVGFAVFFKQIRVATLWRLYFFLRLYIYRRTLFGLYLPRPPQPVRFLLNRPTYSAYIYPLPNLLGLYPPPNLFGLCWCAIGCLLSCCNSHFPRHLLVTWKILFGLWGGLGLHFRRQ